MINVLAPSNDTLITMARLVYEKSEFVALNLNLSFCIGDETTIMIYQHDDEKSTKKLFGTCTIPELVASYIGLGLPFDIDANDAVTTGHRLGNTGR